MNQSISKKDQFLKWWKVEGKIEFAAAAIVFIVLLIFWDNLLVLGIVEILGALWGYGKIFFRRDKWAILLLISTFVFIQGISNLLTYVRL